MEITRREALVRLATLIGASALGPRLLAANLEGTAPASAALSFTAAEIALLDEIGETIIPTTDVPGAKAVGIGAFMVMMVRECYAPHNQAAFQEGLPKISAAFSTRFGEQFVSGKLADRTTLLNELDAEQRSYTAQTRREKPSTAQTDDEALHYFRMMKELTVLGYFTSEIGASKAVNFTEVPGRYDGAASYRRGEHAWFS